jgi:hypothetical protein
VLALLAIETSAGWSDRRLAAVANVSPKFVSKLRRESTLPDPKRLGNDGKKLPAHNKKPRTQNPADWVLDEEDDNDAFDEWAASDGWPEDKVNKFLRSKFKKRKKAGV